MTTATFYPGIPGLAVRVGGILERWGRRNGTRVDRAEMARRQLRCDLARRAAADKNAAARSYSVRLF